MKRALIWALALLTMTVPAFAGPALNYRGPVNEAPKGLVAPGLEGPIGTERLHSRSNRVEGDARWEFWWEMNRAGFLRRALKTNERMLTGVGGDAFYSAEPRPDRQVSAEHSESSILPALISRLTSLKREERCIAAVSLGLAGESGAFKGLREMLGRGSSVDRQAAALGLGFLGDPLAVPDLEQLMKRPGVPIPDRSKAALALGFIGGSEAVSALEKGLKESLKHRSRDAVDLQAAILSALGLAGGKKQVAALVNVVRMRENRSVLVRCAAINALGRIGDDAACTTLIGLLEDRKASIRNAAAEALGMMKSGQARVGLEKLFAGDGDPAVRCRAAMALARLGGDGVGDLLAGGLEVRNPRVVREFAALALGVLGDHAHALRLRALLDGRQGEGLAGAAAISLGILRDNGAMHLLSAMSRNEGRDHSVRGYAVLALGMLGDPVTRKSVGDLARKPGATHVRRTATISLGLFPRVSGSRAILASLFEETDPYVRGAAISSLGIFPREGVADMLLGIVESRGFSAQAKLDALRALGVLARRGAPSRAEELLSDLNYQTAVSSVLEVAGLF